MNRTTTLIFRAAALVSCILYVGCAGHSHQAAKPAPMRAGRVVVPKDGGISNDQIRDVIQRVANHQIHPLADGDYSAVLTLDKAEAAKAPVGIEWGYPWGVALYGMERVAEETGDTNADNFVLQHNQICANYYDWLDGLEDNFGSDATNFTHSTKIKGLMTLGSLDNCGAMGNEMLVSMIRHPDQVTRKERTVVAHIARWVMDKQPRLPNDTLWRPHEYDGTVWPDDLYMGGVFEVRWGVYNHDISFIDDTAQQIINQAALEQDSDGLWFHGYYVSRKMHAPYKWGRGNGWVTVTLVETLSVMPKDDPYYSKLLKILRKQIKGLEKVQAPDGMWRQVLDKPQLWEETSCTAMFAYGIARAVNEGWISKDNMIVARHAFAAASQNVTADGAVLGTCQGTSMSTNLDYYINRERPDNDPHGRGPIMLAGTEILAAQNK